MELTAERLAMLRLRAGIRARNAERPRCSGCGGDLLVFTQHDLVTEQHMSAPGFWYLPENDFRPGDLVCIWCIHGLIASNPADMTYLWGSA